MMYDAMMICTALRGLLTGMVGGLVVRVRAGGGGVIVVVMVAPTTTSAPRPPRLHHVTISLMNLWLARSCSCSCNLARREQSLAMGRVLAPTSLPVLWLDPTGETGPHNLLVGSQLELALAGWAAQCGHGVKHESKTAI